MLCVKTYDLAAAIEQMRPLVGPATAILTLQNGVEAPDLVAAARAATLNGGEYPFGSGIERGHGLEDMPYEDWALAGGVVILDASIEAVDRTGDAYRIHTRSPTGGAPMSFEADDLIAATGFTCPLGDLPRQQPSKHTPAVQGISKHLIIGKLEYRT